MTTQRLPHYVPFLVGNKLFATICSKRKRSRYIRDCIRFFEDCRACPDDKDQLYDLVKRHMGNYHFNRQDHKEPTKVKKELVRLPVPKV